MKPKIIFVLFCILANISIINCSFNQKSSEEPLFIEFHLIDENNQPISNSVITDSSTFAPMMNISDTTGIAIMPFWGESIVYNYFNPKFIDKHKSILITRNDFINEQSYIDQKIVISTDQPKKLTVSVDSLKKHWEKDKEFPQNFKEISTFDLQLIDSLFVNDLIQCGQFTNKDISLFKQSNSISNTFEIIELETNYKSLYDMITFDNYSPIEKALGTIENKSHINYPIILDDKRAVIGLYGSSWWCTKYIELIESNKLRVYILSQWIR